MHLKNGLPKGLKPGPSGNIFNSSFTINLAEKQLSLEIVSVLHPEHLFEPPTMP